MKGPTRQTDLVAFALACAMAALAGATDVCGLYRLHNLFVSFMSGNTTMLAFSIGHGHLARAGTIARLIGLFVFGAFAGTIIAVRAGRRHLSVVTFAVAAMLLAASFWPDSSAALLTLAMGVLNAAMQRAGKTGVALTYVTGALVRFASGLGHAVCRQPTEDRDWPLQGVLWLSLLAGAAISTAALLNWATGDTLRTLAGLAGVLALIAASRPERQGAQSAP